MNIAPTIGRMVYYKDHELIDCPAIITEVQVVTAEDESGIEYETKLAVFSPNTLMFTDYCSQGQKEGQWDWMPYQKDQMARMAPGTANESHVPAEEKE